MGRTEDKQERIKKKTKEDEEKRNERRIRRPTLCNNLYIKKNHNK